MEQAYKLLTMSAGLIVTCAVIGFGLMAFRECREFGNVVLRDIKETTQEYETYKWERYEGTRVSGGEVVSAIRRFQNEIPVVVIQEDKTCTYAGNFRLADNVPSRETYICYGDTYRGEVLYDDKDCLYEIRFYQDSD